MTEQVSKTVRVVALAVGFYGGARRRAGAVFDYRREFDKEGNAKPLPDWLAEDGKQPVTVGIPQGNAPMALSQMGRAQRKGFTDVFNTNPDPAAADPAAADPAAADPAAASAPQGSGPASDPAKFA